MKKILSLILVISSVFVVFAVDANWKIHPIFDEEVTHVVETPSYVYFTSRQRELNPTDEVFLSLFRFDKKGEELLPLSTNNLLNGNSVRDIIYNPTQGYTLVLYKDFDIDVIKNDGSIVNIPYYAQAAMTQSKNVNSMAIDRNNDRVYLATEFGYVAVNDKKNEIAESRIYGEPLSAFCRIGNLYIALKDNDLVAADVDQPRLTLNEYTTLSTFNAPMNLYPVTDNLCLLRGGSGTGQYVLKLKFDNNKVESEPLFFNNYIYNVENNASGVLIATGNTIYQIDNNGTVTTFKRNEAYGDCAAGSANLSEIWNGKKRKGLNSLKKSGDTWSLTRDWMMPNSPATYVSTSFVNHPSKGFLMLNYGGTPATLSLYGSSVYQLSGYKQGRWANYAPAYNNPDRTNLLISPNGMAMDPNNNSYIYVTSYHSGLARINLNDPQDIIHLSYSGDADKDKPGFVILPSHPSTHPSYSGISAPYFDSKGNLWMYFANWDDEADPNPHFYCWTAEDLKATTNASNVKFPKVVEINTKVDIRNSSIGIPLLRTGNGLIVFAANLYKDRLVMLDTNGTPTNTSDDKVYDFQSFTDNDGNEIDIQNTRCLWEDPYTGYVWVGHGNGICYFIPSQVRNGNYAINRVKVARNDGTNLADYLLEGVTVNCITADSDGRKWIGTAGGGVICTSSDGREILQEFNTSNSLLPDDVVYGIGYNSENNSMMFSTSQGYAEYFLTSAQDSSSKTDVRAYPNPVRPEYSGYVTITDIPQGSFVKITDIKGNLVKELGIMSGFEMLWDISDYNFNRVKSGVYHIMVSPSDENSSYSAVGKILVVS